MSAPVPTFQPLQSAVQFGLALAAARAENGLSQAALAERLRVSPASMSFRETNRRNITVGEAIAHLGALGYGLVIVPLPKGGAR